VTIEAVFKMVDACNGALAERNQAILLCLLDSGCRATEFLSLNISDLDLITCAVQVMHGKDMKSRTVYLGKKSRCALMAYFKTRTVYTQQPIW
jgi:site-specific recombinase XerC